MEDSKLGSILEMLTTQSIQHGSAIKKIEETISQLAMNTQASFHNMEIQIGQIAQALNSQDNKRIVWPMFIDDDDCLVQEVGNDIDVQRMQEEHHNESFLEESQVCNEEVVEQDTISLVSSLDLNERSWVQYGTTILYDESKEPSNFIDPILKVRSINDRSNSIFQFLIPLKLVKGE